MARIIPRHEEENDDDDYEMPKNLPPNKMKGSLKTRGRAPNHDDDEMLWPPIIILRLSSFP